MSATAFWILAAIAVVAGIAVFRTASMARATMALLLSFLAVAGLLVALGLGYLGAVVILMMVIEMTIMAVFMIAFMMNPAGLMPMAMYHNRRASLAISGGTFALLATGILVVRWPVGAGTPPADPTFQLGAALMGSEMLTMVVLGLALFATIVAAIVLATSRGRYHRFGDDLARRPPADPVPGGIDG